MDYSAVGRIYNRIFKNNSIKYNKKLIPRKKKREMNQIKKLIIGLLMTEKNNSSSSKKLTNKSLESILSNIKNILAYEGLTYNL